MIFGTEVIPNGMTVLLSSVSIPTRLMIPMLEIQYLAWMGKSIIYIKREKERDVNLMDRGEVRLSLSQTRKNPEEFAGYYKVALDMPLISDAHDSYLYTL